MRQDIIFKMLEQMFLLQTLIKAIVYKLKNGAQSVCDAYNIYMAGHVKYHTLNGDITPKNWSLDIIKSYIEEG